QIITTTFLGCPDELSHLLRSSAVFSDPSASMPCMLIAGVTAVTAIDLRKVRLLLSIQLSI
ncbi:MAG: hypothetical protein P4M11_02560, partial [Candidatus Pacebacteria bacterium]|nr:hypothetical protein [Candidatus Paceibacterota bacterium]